VASSDLLSAPTAEAPKRGDYRVTFAVIVVATAAYSMLQSLVTPVLPTIQASLHTSQSTVTWVLTAYLLSASIATPVIGRLGDMAGKKRMLVIVLATLAVGALLAAVASSIGVLIIARVIQGAGGAILPLAFGIIRDEFPHEKVSMAIGVTAALLAVGAGLGVVLAGPIVDALNYHFLFWLPLIFVALACVAAQLFVPESENRSGGSISLLPALMLTLWLVALLIGVSEGSDWGWGSGRVLGLLAAAVVLIPLWVITEIRAAQPLIDMNMMRIPAVWTTNLVALLMGVGMYSVMAFLPEFLQTPSSAGYGFGATVTHSGLFLLPMTVVMFFFGLLSGRLSDAWGAKWVLLTGSAIAAAAYLLLTLAHDDAWVIYLFSALVGAGMGFAFSAMSAIVVVSVAPNQVGVASGMNANIRTIGGAIGAAVAGSIVTSGASASGLPAESGYTHGFAFMLAAAALSALACLAIPTARRALGSTPEVTRNAETALVPGATIVEED
jgi:EmrB/QacA subfamily drug resistance transporter